MPRKKIIYTDLYPYHIMARANNKEWFYLPMEEVWEIFVSQVNQIVRTYKVEVYAFVLMNNHYHMLAKTHANFNLGIVMQDLQRSVSRKINSKSGRINHVFGGPYKASLIIGNKYYADVFKYIYRNPIEAGICKYVEDYFYSSLIRCNEMLIVRPATKIDTFIPYDNLTFWLNQKIEKENLTSIKKGLRKSQFKPVIPRKY